jgi:hypothetical protein
MGLPTRLEERLFFLQANYMIQTDDGAIINVDNRGRSVRKIPGTLVRFTQRRSSKHRSGLTSG